MVSVQSHYEQLKKTVVQRLKWAAGANPSLAQTLVQFEETLALDQALLDVSSHLEFFVFTVYKPKVVSTGAIQFM